MDTAEVALLFKRIKRAYPSFNVGVDQVRFWQHYLKDTPAEVAEQNLDRHIISEKFPPAIADLIQPLDESVHYHAGMKRRAAEFFVEDEALTNRILNMSQEEQDRIRDEQRKVREFFAKSRTS